jgi:hypothetical protein
MSYSSQIGIRINAVDEASAVFKQLANNAEASYGAITVTAQKVEEQQKKTNLSLKDGVTAFSGVATSAFALYNIYDRVADMTVSVDRANLQVKTTLNSVEDAQKRLNDAVAKYGPNSEQALAAQKDLTTAQERYQVACERAEMMQGNLNEAMVQGALMIVPTMTTMVTSLQKVWGPMTSALESAGLSFQSLAVAGASAVGAFVGVYGILTSLPPNVRETAAVIAILTGALIAAATAAVVMWTSVSLGTALPVLLVGIATAAAGVAVACQGASTATQELGNHITTLQEQFDAVQRSMDEAAEAEETRYQKELDDIAKSWDNRLGLTETALGQLEDKINRYWDDRISTVQQKGNEELDQIQSAYNEQYRAVQTSYDEQIAATNQFWDDLVASTTAGLNNIRAERTRDLDNLELDMLRQKVALEQAHDAGLIDEEDNQKQMSDLTQSYSEERGKMSDSYRLQELEEEKKIRDDLVDIASDRETDLTRIKAEEDSTLAGMEDEHNATMTAKKQELNATVQGLEQQRAGDIAAAQADMEAAEQTHQDNMAGIVQSGEAQMLAITQSMEYQRTQAIQAAVAANEAALAGETVAASQSPYVGGAPKTGAAVPVYQHGGIAWTPQLAFLAEKEPELIIPLSRLGAGGAAGATRAVTIHIHHIHPFIHIGNVSQAMDLKKVREVLMDELVQAVSDAFKRQEWGA